MGKVDGTPTLRFFRTGKRGKKVKVEKIDYNGERKAKSMYKAAVREMPTFAESIIGEASFDTFLSKASKYGLPIAVVLSTKSSLSPLIKSMSAQYRRRLLIGVVNRRLSKNIGVIKRLEENENAIPAEGDVLYILSAAATIKATFSPQKTFKYHGLNGFLSKHALKAPYNIIKQEL